MTNDTLLGYPSNSAPKKKRTLLIIGIVIAVLVIVGSIVAGVVLTDANKKARAAAEAYSKAIVAYTEQVRKAPTTAAIKTAIRSTPKLQDVSFGNFTHEYQVAESREVIQKAYSDRALAMVENLTDARFDTQFRALDTNRSEITLKSYELGRSAEKSARNKEDKISEDQLNLVLKGVPKTDQRYKAKEAELTKAKAAITTQPFIVEYTARAQYTQSYRDKLAKLPSNTFVEQYKQGMLRATDKDIKDIKTLVEAIKKAKTPGDASRAEYIYRHINGPNNDKSYYDARWASEEAPYVNASGYMSYVMEAMKALAAEKSIPTDKNEAVLYGDILYYGRQASSIIPKDRARFTRSYQAKVRFGLTELRNRIEKSTVSQEMKKKYLGLVDKAQQIVTIMPGEDTLYDRSTLAGENGTLSGLINFANNMGSLYTDVSGDSGVADRDSSEELMRYEAKAIKDFYNNTVRARAQPKTDLAKKEIEAVIKQLDTCMAIRFTRNNLSIEQALGLKKLEGTDASSSVVYDLYDPQFEKLEDQNTACSKKVAPLYEIATKQSMSYATASQLAIKQLEALR